MIECYEAKIMINLMRHLEITLDIRLTRLIRNKKPALVVLLFRAYQSYVYKR